MTHTPINEGTNFFLRSKLLRQTNILIKGSKFKQELTDTIELILEMATTLQCVDETLYTFIKNIRQEYEHDVISLMAISKVCEHIDNFFEESTDLTEFILSVDNCQQDDDEEEEEDENDDEKLKTDKSSIDEDSKITEDDDDEEEEEDKKEDEDLDTILDGIESDVEEISDVIQQNISDSKDTDELLSGKRSSSKPKEYPKEELRKQIGANTSVKVKKEDVLDLSHLSQASTGKVEVKRLPAPRRKS